MTSPALRLADGLGSGEGHDGSGRGLRGGSQFVDLLAQLHLRSLEEVAIEAERHGWVAVSHALRQGEQVYTQVDEDRGVRMSQVVRAEGFGESGIAQGGTDHLLTQFVPIERVAVASLEE